MTTSIGPFQWCSVDDCELFAMRLASFIDRPLTIALIGTLGAGKTQFAKCIVAAMSGDAGDVSSPTFVLLHEYAARLPIVHIDLYRLNSEQELDSFGFFDIVYSPVVSLIEWANKFPEAMPKESLTMTIELTPKGGRQVRLVAEEGTFAASIAKSMQTFSCETDKD